MSSLLALFTRSLRLDARSKSTHFARAGLIIVMLTLLGFTHATSGWSGAPGLAFFRQTMFIDFFFISLAGLSYFSSAITEEKEEMTLGLLRMTNLNPLSILLGKSTSRLCGALLLLAAQLPFTLLAVAFGGISTRQIMAAYCTLAGYILLLSNLALLFSVTARRTASAAFFTGLMLFIYLVGYSILPGLLSAIGYLFGIELPDPGAALGGFLARWKSSSPLERLGTILQTGFNDRLIGTQVLSNIIAGVALFLLPWAVFNTFNAEQRESIPIRGRVGRSGQKREWSSAGRAWKQALIWKDFHFLAGGFLGGHSGSVIKLIVYGLFLGTIVWKPQLWGRSAVHWDAAGFTIMGFMGFLVAVELTIAAARIFRHERRWRTLSSLAMLPSSLGSIAYQKVLGALLVVWPGVLYFFIGLMCASGTIWEELHKLWSKPNHGLASMIGQIAFGGFAFFVIQPLFFLHLVANLSLRVKWGTIPLAIAINYLFFTFTMMTVMFLVGQGMLFVLAIMFIAATIFLHVNTGARLRELAAEE